MNSCAHPTPILGGSSPDGRNLEDHPRTDGYVVRGPPHVASHEGRPFGRGPTTPIVRDETDDHGYDYEPLAVMG